MTLSLSRLFGRSGSPLRGSRVLLVEPDWQHYDDWWLLRETSRQHLEPFEPAWAADELSRQAFRRRLKRYRFDRRQGTGAAYFVVESKEGTLLGGLTLTNIRRGVTQSASLGYWIGLPFVRNGYASEAVGIALAHAFDGLGLNRVDAACMPANTASIAVLGRAGFRQEGLARSYLRINGVFEDHLLFGRLRSDRAIAIDRGATMPAIRQAERSRDAVAGLEGRAARIGCEQVEPNGQAGQGHPA
jgi:ribosomal-protein-alanine N-acetyltransferase